MFADIESNAEATDYVFMLIETVLANGHNQRHYLSFWLTALPHAQKTAYIDALPAWPTTPDEIAEHDAYVPTPRKTPYR